MKLYLDLNEQGSKMKQFRRINEIENIEDVGYEAILGIKPNSFSMDALTESVNFIYPDVSYNGYGYLDIEAEYGSDLLTLDASEEDFQKALEHFISVIRFVKSLRPNMKWGYYGIPFTTYWERTTSFYYKSEKIKQLLIECDVFYPTMYNFYADTEQFNENELYVTTNIKQMIKIGLEYNKPVIVFIWHRYHSSTKLSLQRLPDEVFLKHIERIKNTTYLNSKVQGVLWWSAEDWFFNTEGKENTRFEFEGTAKEYAIWNDNLLYNLSNKVIELLSTTPTPTPTRKKKCWLIRFLNFLNI